MQNILYAASIAVLLITSEKTLSDEAFAALITLMIFSTAKMRETIGKYPYTFFAAIFGFSYFWISTSNKENKIVLEPGDFILPKN